MALAMRCKAALAALALSLASAKEAHEAGQKPSILKAVPFTKIADEIYEAERSVQELEWKAGNSTQEKASIQWFIATTLQEINRMKKETMNTSHNGSLGQKYEICYNKTVGRMPNWNASRSISENIKADKSLAPTTVEARMYELYDAERKSEELTMQLGQCNAKCAKGSSFLSKGSKLSVRISMRKARKQGANNALVREDQPAPAPAPAPAPGGGGAGPPPKPSPRELMKSVADAIYNTSQSMASYQELLKKDKSAKDVLQAISGVIMSKLLMAKKDMEQMEKDLEECSHTPEATHLGDPMKEAMGENADMTMEMMDVATAQADSAKKTVQDLEERLADCKARCEI